MTSLDVLAVARGVAESLGREWKAIPGVWDNGEDARLTGPDGAGLHLRLTDTWKVNGARLEISGSFEQRVSDRIQYNEKRSFQITVAPGKAPERIAGDIRRRLLPEYLEMLAVAQQRAEEFDKAVRAKDERLNGLASNLPGGKRGEREPDSVYFGGGRYGDRPVCGEVKESYDGTEWTVRIKSRENALALAAFLSKLTREA